MRRIIAVCALIALSAGSLPAQERGPAATSDVEVTTPSPEIAPSPSAPAAGSGLPQVAPPPRTLRAYWHLFGAYAIVWTLLFGYAVFLGRRSGAIERQIERLEGGAGR